MQNVTIDRGCILGPGRVGYEGKTYAVDAPTARMLIHSGAAHEAAEDAEVEDESPEAGAEEVGTTSDEPDANTSSDATDRDPKTGRGNGRGRNRTR